MARAIALYDFNAVESGDLSFAKGDIIIVTKKSDSSDDWYALLYPSLTIAMAYLSLNVACRWTGKAGGKQGIFPANFVELA